MKKYCTIIKKQYRHIYNTVSCVKMCIDKTLPIFEVDIITTLTPLPSSYYGWENNYGGITHIHASRNQVDMAFLYGADVEEQKGRGKVVRIDIYITKQVR